MSVSYPLEGDGRTAVVSARRREALAGVVRLVTVRLVRDGSFTAPARSASHRAPIRSPRDVYALMAPYAEREIGESLWILALDTQNRLATPGPTVITRGILDSALIHPREVFLAAIAAQAAALVLVHNHPSGDPTPSQDDRTVTHQLVVAGRLLDIPVRDHVIIGHGRYMSFAEAAQLE